MDFFEIYGIDEVQMKNTNKMKTAFKLTNDQRME